MIIILTVILITCSARVVISGKVLLNLTSIAPTSNSSGYSFTSIASSHQTSTGTYVCEKPPLYLEVDQRVKRLRDAGQKSPASLIYGPVKLSNPFSDNSPEIEYQALIDTGAAFSIIPLLVMQQLAIPLGSECSVNWGGKK